MLIPTININTLNLLSEAIFRANILNSAGKLKFQYYSTWYRATVMCIRHQAFCQNAMMVLISGVQLSTTYTVISFDQTTYSVSEGSGKFTVTVYLIGGIVSGDEIVTVSTEPGGTATGEIVLKYCRPIGGIRCIDHLCLYSYSWMFANFISPLHTSDH